MCTEIVSEKETRPDVTACQVSLATCVRLTSMTVSQSIASEDRASMESTRSRASATRGR